MVTYTDLKKIETIANVVKTLQVLNICTGPYNPVWNLENETLSFSLMFGRTHSNGLELATKMFQTLGSSVVISKTGLRLNVLVQL